MTARVTAGLRAWYGEIRPEKGTIGKEALAGIPGAIGSVPDGMAAAIDTSAWTIPPVFELMRRLGNIPEDDYRRTFNLGIGMILAVPAARRKRAAKILRRLGEPWLDLGEVVRRKRHGPRVEYR